MENVITEFIQEQSWNYNKTMTEEGSNYFRTGVVYDSNSYNIIFEYDFAEKYFAVTAVTEKKLPVKYSKKVMNEYNLLAQQQIPVTRIFTEHGMVASKYNYELLDDEKLTIKRVDYMLNTALIDVVHVYSYLKKIIKNSKKKD